MKLCITVGTEDAFPGALVVFRGLDNNLKTISELGYDGIELSLFKRENVEICKLKSQLSEYGLKLPVISTGQLFTMQGVWFTHPDKEIRDKAVNTFCEIIDVASEFGADINVSRVRGYIHAEDTYESAIDKLTDCMFKISGHAQRYGLNIVLEQMNRYETNYMFSVLEVGEYIRSVGIPNLKIHADVFHMNIEDRSITGSLEQYKDLLGYIHFADSNRLAPGQGHIDFTSIIDTLRKISYNGWTSVEALAVPDAYTAANLSIEHLRKVISGLQSR